MESPFEPLSSAILKFVTLKTIFLLAIASGRRRNGLQALGCDSGHIRWGPSGVVLIPHPGFLAKNESQNYMAKRIYLPKMSTFSSVKGDRLLCPRRALSYYLTKTKMLRKLIKQLFITYKEGCHRAASHDAISKCGLFQFVIRVQRSQISLWLGPMIPGLFLLLWLCLMVCLWRKSWRQNHGSPKALSRRIT